MRALPLLVCWLSVRAGLGTISLSGIFGQTLGNLTQAAQLSNMLLAAAKTKLKCPLLAWAKAG
jgi:hypothetical protein